MYQKEMMAGWLRHLSPVTEKINSPRLSVVFQEGGKRTTSPRRVDGTSRACP
jgi:hypothetical protein